MERDFRGGGDLGHLGETKKSGLIPVPISVAADGGLLFFSRQQFLDQLQRQTAASADDLDEQSEPPQYDEQGNADDAHTKAGLGILGFQIHGSS